MIIVYQYIKKKSTNSTNHKNKKCCVVQIFNYLNNFKCLFKKRNFILLVFINFCRKNLWLDSNVVTL